MSNLVLGIMVWSVLTSALLSADRGLVVDHTSLDLFDRIPEKYLKAARQLRVLFMNRSVGVNTHDSLNCLTAETYGSARVTCRRDYRHDGGEWRVFTRGNEDLARGTVPGYINFSPSPRLYDRSNWDFYLFYDTWDKMVTGFITGLDRGAIPVRIHPTNESTEIDPLAYDLLSFQFGYLNVRDGSKINSFFSERPGQFDDVYDLEREIEEHLSSAEPPRVFVYWTTNLARGIGSSVSSEFNQRMREWCAKNDRILFDFADIQAHDMFGRSCYDNRDGVFYATPRGNKSENHPDDGLQIPAICQEKTFETDGGHLATAQGTVSVAKGLWVLVAQVAGWNPG